MNQWTIKIITALALVLLLFPVLRTAEAQSTMPLAQDKALDFFTNVLHLDMTRYKASLTRYDKSSGPSNKQQEFVSYDLEDNGKIGTVNCRFEENLLRWCMVTAPGNDSLVYAQQSSNTLDAAKGIIERYQTFLGDSGVKEMLDLLETVESGENITAKAGALRLDITVPAPYTIFRWKHSFNGCDYNEVELAFEQGGQCFTFSDGHSRDRMGSTDVNISEEQAIELAIEYVKNYSYTVRRPDAEGNEIHVEIGDFNISRERTVAQLSPSERNNLLYPVWKVDVALATVYPGNVYAIGVDIWADTAEIAYTALQSFGGSLPIGTDNPATGSSSPPQENNGSTTNNNTASVDASSIGIIGAVVGVAAVAIITVAFKKRKRK
jgi:hypothetical protein